MTNDDTRNRAWFETLSKLLGSTQLTHAVAKIEQLERDNARFRGIIARNAMQRLDSGKIHVTPDDIASSIEIAAEYRLRFGPFSNEQR
jgi:hypothetical protein